MPLRYCRVGCSHAHHRGYEVREKDDDSPRRIADSSSFIHGVPSAMGYILLIICGAAVLVVIAAIFFSRSTRTNRGSLGPHVTPSQPYADEANPDQSVVNSSKEIEEAKSRTPPA
ncbi:MAG: hypothetical protein QM715_03435 [Nibricoccus sp.]